jgi:hypothetical protein
MNPPPPPNGLIGPHGAHHIQPPLPPQQPGLSSLDGSQSTWDAHFNSTHHPEGSNNGDPFHITASNVPRSSVQNVNPPSQPFLTNSQILDRIWPLFIQPLPDRSSLHSSTTQNTQPASACPTCPTHSTSGPVQFGGERPAPVVQDSTAASAPAPSSSPFSNPTAPHPAPPVPEPLLFRPGVASAGPSTTNAYGRRSKRPRPRRPPGVPFVRIEDRIEWVSRDVMKMTLWFNWSPDAEAEAHDAWERAVPI